MVTQNWKKVKEIIDELEADILAYNEHKLNLKYRDNTNGFSQLFNEGKDDYFSVVVVHNNHEIWVEYRMVAHTYWLLNC